MASWIKKHKALLFIIILSIAALAAAFFLAETPSSGSKKAPAADTSASIESTSQVSRPESRAQTSHTQSSTSAFSDISSGDISSSVQDKNDDISEQLSSATEEKPSQSAEQSDHKEAAEQASSYASESVSEQKESSVQEEASFDHDNSEPSAALSSESVSEKQLPVVSAPSGTSESSREEAYCTLSITCQVLADDPDSLPKNKRQLIPADGVILGSLDVPITEGESVFDITRRVCMERQIPFEFTLTPVYNTAYIEGIFNLYEFDSGSGSGWVYAVNDVLPGVGCSETKLRNGDRVEWLYTRDLGHDAEALIKERTT